MKGCRIGDLLDESKFEVALGMSRKWDAREAGKEVAREVIQKLSSPPSFFLLFSTIHYDKHGGFEEFLDGVWDVLPEGTPLIGGTVAGFINNYGCYTRGATALAVSYPNMDVAVGVGRNTKRNPQKAASECAQMIKEELDNSTYKNKFVFDLISGGIIPQFPGMGRKKVIKGFMGKLSINLTGFSTKYLQKGIGREDEVMEEFTSNLKDYKILGGSSMDDYNFLNNYQFFNNQVLKNSMVALGIRTDSSFDVSMVHGMKETNISFEVTKLSRNKRFIHEINNKPALQELLKLLNWPAGEVNENMYRRTFYYPFCFEKDNNRMPGVILMFLSDSMLVSYQIENQKVDILTTSGKDLINAVDENLDPYKEKNIKFGIIVSCGIRLMTLSKNIYKVREKLLKNFNDQPFLLFYTNGESTYIPDKGLKSCNDTFNSAVFWN